MINLNKFKENIKKNIVKTIGISSFCNVFGMENSKESTTKVIEGNNSCNKSGMENSKKDITKVTDGNNSCNKFRIRIFERNDYNKITLGIKISDDIKKLLNKSENLDIESYNIGIQNNEFILKNIGKIYI